MSLLYGSLGTKYTREINSSRAGIFFYSDIFEKFSTLSPSKYLPAVLAGSKGC
jgi:hypothetical protein